MAKQEQKSALIKFFKEDINDISTLQNGFWGTVKRAFKLAYRAETGIKIYQLINPLNLLEAIVLLPAELLDRASLIGMKENTPIGVGRKLVRTVLNLARIPHLLIRPITYPSKYLLANSTQEFTRSDMLIAASILLIAALAAGLIAAIILTGGFGIPALAAFAGAASTLGVGVAGLTGLSAAAAAIVADAILIGGTFILLAKVVPAVMEELQGMFSYLFVRDKRVESTQVAQPAERQRVVTAPNEETNEAKRQEQERLAQEKAAEEVERKKAEEAAEEESKRLAEEAKRKDEEESERKHLAERKEEKQEDLQEHEKQRQADENKDKQEKKRKAVQALKELVDTEKSFCDNMQNFSAFLIEHVNFLDPSLKKEMSDKKQKSKTGKANTSKALLKGQTGLFNRLLHGIGLKEAQLNVPAIIERYKAMVTSPLLAKLGNSEDITEQNLEEKVHLLYEVYASEEFRIYTGKMFMLTLIYNKFSALLTQMVEEYQAVNNRPLSAENTSFCVNYAIQPIQRLMRYRLTTKELIDHLKEVESISKEHPDRLLKLISLIVEMGNRLIPKNDNQKGLAGLTSTAFSQAVVEEAQIQIPEYANLSNEFVEQALTSTMEELGISENFKQEMLASLNLKPDQLIIPVQESADSAPSTAIPSSSSGSTASIANNLSDSMFGARGSLKQNGHQGEQVSSTLPVNVGGGEPEGNKLIQGTFFNKDELGATIAPATQPSSSSVQGNASASTQQEKKQKEDGDKQVELPAQQEKKQERSFLQRLFGGNN